MNAQSSVREQLTFWHDALGQMLADCGQEVLNNNLPGATITSIGSIYAHLVFSEDFIVHGMLQGKSSLYQSQGWDAKLGVELPGTPPFIRPEWGRATRMDLPAFQEYARAVYAATDAYLAGLSESDLQKTVKTPGGERPAAWALTIILGTHFPQHAGEIAALKGVQGLKGLPF